LFFSPTHLSSHGVSFRNTPFPIHHSVPCFTTLTLFPIRSSQTILCHVFVRVSVLSPQLVFFFHLSIVFCYRRVTPITTAVFLPSSSPSPFSMYIVVHSLRSYTHTSLPPTCFISPYFSAVHERGCMYDNVYAESLSWKRGKNGKFSSCRFVASFRKVVQDF